AVSSPVRRLAVLARTPARAGVLPDALPGGDGGRLRRHGIFRSARASGVRQAARAVSLRVDGGPAPPAPGAGLAGPAPGQYQRASDPAGVQSKIQVACF